MKAESSCEIEFSPTQRESNASSQARSNIIIRERYTDRQSRSGRGFLGDAQVILVLALSLNTRLPLLHSILADLFIVFSAGFLINFG